MADVATAAPPTPALAPAPAPAPASAPAAPASVPLSFPAILGPRLAHLGLTGHTNKDRPSSASGKKKEAAQQGGSGKRRLRRLANAQLADNPHIRRPTRADYDARPARPTGPVFAPPPPAFSRKHLASADLPDSPGQSTSSNVGGASAEFGQYSLSLRGVRKTLRRSAGGRGQQFVAIVEGALVEWLGASGRIAPSFYHQSTTGRIVDHTPMPSLQGEDVPAVVELSKSPAGLVWRVADPFDRYVLHALCRYYHLQSSSHPESGSPSTRLTRIWRPHVARPQVQSALRGMDSPPVTDLSEMGTSASERGGTTEVEETETEGETDGEWSYVGETEQWTEDELSVGARTRESSRVREISRSSESEREGLQSSTDDDAISVGSAEQAISTDDDETDADGGVDSLVSSLASLPPTSTPARYIPSTLSDSTPISSTSVPAFVPFTPSGTATPTRTSERTPRASFQVTGSGAIATRGTAGRRSLGGGDVRDSSPSRSPQREVGAVRALLRVRRDGAGREGWEWPVRSFEEFLYE